MNINALIDSLMIYAQEHLLLDDLDYVFSRNQIIQKLKITDYEEYEIDSDEIYDMPNPYQILDRISAYAIEQGLIAEKEKQSFEAEIMNFIIKRPSEVADTFNDLLSQGKTAKAFSWLCEYNQKSGYIKSQNIINHWEAKGTKGKIEIFITKNMDTADLKKYAGCLVCHQTEGYGVLRSMRSVPIEIGGENYLWRLDETPCAQGIGSVVWSRHQAMPADAKSVERLFDYADIAQNYFVAFMEGESEHGCFKAAAKTLPVHRAPDLRKLKSSEYPYINITEVDWYGNVLRLSCTNKEKLIEFILKLIGAFKSADEKNRVALSVRKSDKYTIEMFFQDGEPHVADNPCVDNVDILGLMGLFVLDEVVAAEMKQLESYLTKEVKYSESKLPDNMVKYKDMITRLLKEIGSTKISGIEAQIDVKEEVNTYCEESLIKSKAFGVSSGEGSFDSFLNGAGIK